MGLIHTGSEQDISVEEATLTGILDLKLTPGGDLLVWGIASGNVTLISYSINSTTGALTKLDTVTGSTSPSFGAAQIADLLIVGDYAYVAITSSINIFDITDTSNLIYVGNHDPSGIDDFGSFLLTLGGWHYYDGHIYLLHKTIVGSTRTVFISTLDIATDPEIPAIVGTAYTLHTSTTSTAHASLLGNSGTTLHVGERFASTSRRSEISIATPGTLSSISTSSPGVTMQVGLKPHRVDPDVYVISESSPSSAGITRFNLSTETITFVSNTSTIITNPSAAWTKGGFCFGTGEHYLIVYKFAYTLSSVDYYHIRLKTLNTGLTSYTRISPPILIGRSMGGSGAHCRSINIGSFVYFTVGTSTASYTPAIHIRSIN